jgi:hypothetical protein
MMDCNSPRTHYLTVLFALLVAFLTLSYLPPAMSHDLPRVLPGPALLADEAVLISLPVTVHNVR